MTTIPPISPVAAKANTAPATPDSTQPLDRARLDKLRAAIQAGQYPLDPGKLAASMLDLRETLGK